MKSFLLIFSLGLVSFLCWPTTSIADHDPSFHPSFVDVVVTSEGRVHAGIRIPDGFASDPIRQVTITEEGVDIFVKGELVVPLPPLPPRFFAFTFDNLPSGDLALRIRSEDSPESILGEIEVRIPEDRRLRSTLAPIRFWPPDATVLDEIWLLIEPIDFCSEVSGDQLTFEEVSVPCQVESPNPVLAALNIGRVSMPGIAPFQIWYSRGDIAGRFKLELLVQERIPSRVAGTWYDRAQSGHGISLQVLDDESMLVFWYTFDDDGNPAWILAHGAHEGLEAVLPAHVALGGRFPPNFDPDDIERLDWGELRIQFHSCDRATMRWSTDFPGFSDGEMPLERLSRTADHSCAGPPPPAALVPDWYQGPGTYFRLPD